MHYLTKTIANIWFDIFTCLRIQILIQWWRRRGIRTPLLGMVAFPGEGFRALVNHARVLPYTTLRLGRPTATPWGETFLAAICFR